MSGRFGALLQKSRNEGKDSIMCLVSESKVATIPAPGSLVARVCTWKGSAAVGQDRQIQHSQVLRKAEWTGEQPSHSKNL